MCSISKSVELPPVPEPPPPPDETAQTFSTIREEQQKKSTAKKKRGTDALRVQNRSPLVIPDNESSFYGLNIP
ncbi:MAG: hypothetical protein IJD28_07105 [Deferribacterales bacterium]|nr:hypothetical protein [Deferribacterales bacterium]